MKSENNQERHASRGNRRAAAYARSHEGPVAGPADHALAPFPGHRDSDRSDSKGAGPGTACRSGRGKPARSGSCTTDTTSTGSTTVTPQMFAVTITSSPCETGPGASTEKPLAVFTFHRSTSKAACSHLASPRPTTDVTSDRRYPRSLLGHPGKAGLVMPHPFASCTYSPLTLILVYT